MPTLHKGVGMNRPKKRKLSPLVPGPIFAEDTPEPEEACPAPAPAPSPSPPPTAPEEPKQDARCPSDIQILYYRVKQAEKNFIKVRRRWVKTARTYLPKLDCFGSARSELVRVHERLLQVAHAPSRPVDAARGPAALGPLARPTGVALAPPVCSGASASS